METASDVAVQIDRDLPEVQPGPAAQRLLLPGAVLAGVGFLLALVAGLVLAEDTRLFWHAYLVAYTFYLSIALGALFFVLLHHLSRAGWSATLRRVAEALSMNVLLMAVLAAPLLLGMGVLFEWSHPELVEADPVLAGKSAYLNPTFFILRLILYFAVWGGLAWTFRARSIRQDRTGDVSLSLLLEKVSAPGMIALALTMTFASVDLLMSLNPHWQSTIFGVYFFSGSVMAGLIVLALLVRWLQAQGTLGTMVTLEHYHDLGKLTFAFVFFWGYIAFSQYMLIWYANLPEETQFFIPRQIGPWVWVSLALLFFHLLLPWLGLLSRHAKRNLAVFTFWGVWLLLAHLLDLFWIVMPNVFTAEIPKLVNLPPGSSLPPALPELVASRHSIYHLAERHAEFMHQVTAPLGVVSLLTLLGLVLGMGGLFLLTTARFLQAAPLVPLRDPRLPEALAFENL